MISNKPAAYTWDDAQSAKGRIAVTILCTDARKQLVERAAETAKARYSNRTCAYVMSPAQFRRFQAAFAEVCKHPALRLYAWLAHDPPLKRKSRRDSDYVLCSGCSDCGTVFPEHRLPKKID